MYALFFFTIVSAFALERSHPAGKSGQVVEREGYVLQYNSECRVPHWVSYLVRASDLVPNVSRTDDFRPDPELKVPQAALADYKNSGYDRGHMARAGLFTRSRKVMSESFILSNIIPQDRYMNQSGAWRRLEEFEEAAIRKNAEVNIVSGPVVGPNDQHIGENAVCVPETVFKVLYRGGENPSAIGFLIPNYRTTGKYTEYAVTVDEVEAATGIDFFPELPDSVEASVEREFSLNSWITSP